MRLNKYLGESGAWSRREADGLIEAGRVTVNGAPAALGVQVQPGDDVRVDGSVVGAARKKARPVYIALNKPVGITCTTERDVAGNIVDFVDHEERVFPIGRLDKDSEGLILLTNDGDIVNEVLRAENAHDKEYVVAVDHQITEEFITKMGAGVRLSDATTRKCRVTWMGPRVFKIILQQGLNRQIRRMCAAFGYEVIALQRVRIMHIRLDKLPVGKWRNLTQQEIDGLMGGPRGKPAPRPSAPPQVKPAGGPKPGTPASRAGSRAPRPRSKPRGRR
jgi:23S rRNA pseudouridine2604 synthase